jgi:Ca2+-binding RTX toxin-like protein
MTLSASALAAATASALSGYVGQGVDTFAVTPSAAVSLSIAQFDAVHGNGASFTGLGALTIADSGANLGALTGTELSAFAAAGATSVTLDASDNALSLSLAQLSALHTNHVGLAADDTVTVLDTQTNIQNLTAASISLLLANGIDLFSATGGTLAMNALQMKAVLDGDGAFASGNTVTFADTGAHIASLSTAQFQALAAAGVDAIDATNDRLSLTVAQYQGLGAVGLTAGDKVTLVDTGAHLAGLASFSGLAAAGIDQLDASDDKLVLTVAQYNALGAVKLTAGDTVTLSDTGAALSALTLTDIRALAHGGIDKIDASDNVLTLSVDEFKAIANNLAFSNDDSVTLADAGSRFHVMNAATLMGLSAQGVDGIDATDNAITFSKAQYAALGSLHIAADDTITVYGGAGKDTIQGDNGTLVLQGRGGNDTLGAGAGDNTLDGGTGIDTASYASATGGVSVDLGAGTGTTTTGHDVYIDIENVAGSGFADTITGNSGENVLTGGSGDDILTGGGNADVLAGNFGADTFVYLSVQDSTANRLDVITDFSHAEGDMIDVSGIAAFSFVQSLDHHAGELAVIDQGGGVYQVVGDVDGDGKADLTIVVHSLTALTADDFVL